MPAVALHGHVVDASTDEAIDAGRVCLTSGDALVAGAELRAAENFRLDTEIDDGAYYALILIGGFDGWRRRIDVAGAPVDVDTGTLRLRPSELSPGVHAQAWDVLADRPVSVGSISLRRDEQLVANARIEGDGWVSFDLTCRQPLPPGRYSLLPDIAGYVVESTPLTIVEKVTVYQLGRLDLWPLNSAAPAWRE